MKLCTSNLNDFNPRSREGSDSGYSSCDFYNGISIHAPARGATTASAIWSICCKISIHAPARGATQHRQRQQSIQHYFNPRSREGSDSTEQLIDETPYQFQSTLPRGERRRQTAGQEQAGYFNPRSREGSDAIDHGMDVTDLQFQSTLPRGERR